MKRLHLMLLLAAIATVAMSVVGGIGASTAFAGSGPLWLVDGERFDCENTGHGQYATLLECLQGGGSSGTAWELKTLTSTEGLLQLDQGALALALNLSGTTNFVLHTSIITIVCKHMHSEIVLVGGTPAKDHARIHFLECEVEGHADCTVNSPGAPIGLVQVSAKSEVVYLEVGGGKMGDLFSPESGETLVELVIGGVGCPAFAKGEQEVKGTVIGEIEPVNKMSKIGLLIFPSTAIKKAFQWESPGKLKEIKSSLSVFGVIEATLSGEAEVMLNSNQAWGLERE